MYGTTPSGVGVYGSTTTGVGVHGDTGGALNGDTAIYATNNGGGPPTRSDSKRSTSTGGDGAGVKGIARRSGRIRRCRRI